MNRAADSPITPPATLGIIGGGQLGRYFVIAARTMGFGTMVLEPDASAPAVGLAHTHLAFPYDHDAALEVLAQECAVVTTEFENPPATALAQLERSTLVHPSAQAIAIAQDRLAEKRFLAGIGVPIARFAAVESDDDVAAAAAFPYPAILKTARLGYDGKGQVRVEHHHQLADAWTELGRGVCVLEQRLALDREVSVVLARTASGQVSCFPTAENVHVDGILDLTVVPATPAPGAHEVATTIAHELGYVGVLAVEMFVVDGELVVNELAPRPHNSGHWTLDACRTSQFEQQVRAVCGLPLGTTELTAPAVAMVNLLGDLWDGGEPKWETALGSPTAKLHLYGKRQARPGRKMGHLTVTAGDGHRAAQLALRLRDETGNVPGS